MRTQTLDDFSDLSGWSAIASGQARLQILPEPAPAPKPGLEWAPGGCVMRLDFDFHGGGGFVVARKPIALVLPESYALRLRVRAEGPPNVFELKLVDPGGANVWRYRDEGFDFGSSWRVLRIRGSEIDFGWGPAGGGVPRQVGAIELVVAAGPGGKGSLWIADLRLEDLTSVEPALAIASGALPGHPAECALDGRTDTCWCPDRGPAWLRIDLREQRDYGGLILHWDSPAGRGFEVLAADEGEEWCSLYSAPCSGGRESWVFLPGGRSRYLKIQVEGEEGAAPPGLVAVQVQPEGVGRSIDGFFHHLAALGARGRYPRWLYREQSYWTPVDVPDGAVPALFNEEGMVEIGRAGFSVEPFLWVDGRCLTWADCAPRQGLLRPPLPIPESIWTYGALSLRVTAFAAAGAGGGASGALLYLRYRLENGGSERDRVTLFVAVRPFQVSPPWQGYRDIGGVSPIRELAYEDGLVRVNGVPALVPLSPPAGFGAALFDQGPISDYLAAGRLPEATGVSDAFGYASGALRFDLELPPGGSADVFLSAPPGEAGRDAGVWLARSLRGPQQLDLALEQWARVLGGVTFDLPAPAQDGADACKGALAHILINRDGPALQPGPRRYTRSWIRDGAVMAAALLRLGRGREAGDFIRWYARFQGEDGNVPCCVDAQGPDLLPEHDSLGQLIFAVADYYRFTGDRGLVEDLWPALRAAVGYLERLRARRLTDSWRDAERLACFGLLPESVSHEGYLAHPVHSYWDDFWALRGLKDAVELAQVLGDSAEGERLAGLRDSFRATLHDSIARTMETRGIDFIPASVEWADPDPTALANALTLIDEAHRLPPDALRRSFDLFMERFRAMHGEHPVAWNNYTPYEIRIAGALVRLGRRTEAHELLTFFLAERRPPVWNQWPEIAWQDPRAPGHQGDLPHAWIGAEYCLVFRNLFAYEREADRSLVVGAGIPAQWLDVGPVSVRDLPTWYGRLDLWMARTGGGTLEVRIGGDLRLPPGGIRVAPPVPVSILEVWVNGSPSADFTAAEVHVGAVPATVTLSC